MPSHEDVILLATPSHTGKPQAFKSDGKREGENKQRAEVREG